MMDDVLESLDTVMAWRWPWRALSLPLILIGCLWAAGFLFVQGVKTIGRR